MAFFHDGTDLIIVSEKDQCGKLPKFSIPVRPCFLWILLRARQHGIYGFLALTREVSA